MLYTVLLRSEPVWDLFGFCFEFIPHGCFRWIRKSASAIWQSLTTISSLLSLYIIFARQTMVKTIRSFLFGEKKSEFGFQEFASLNMKLQVFFAGFWWMIPIHTDPSNTLKPSTVSDESCYGWLEPLWQTSTTKSANSKRSELDLWMFEMLQRELHPHTAFFVEWMYLRNGLVDVHPASQGIDLEVLWLFTGHGVSNSCIGAKVVIMSCHS